MSNSTDSTSRDDIGAVLGRTPSGLFVLTARNAAGDETGMLASWVQQASFEPPAVTVAVNRKRFLNDWLAESPQVVLNLVGETQKQFLGHFGRGFEPGVPAFEGLNTTQAANGITALADALGWLEGTVTAQAEAGDHVVYVVEITAAAQGAKLEAEKPWVHIRKNGFGY
jgi:flavin reductase (DIM6/NTAB) family NADH-FMN oxidoreductase RutF